MKFYSLASGSTGNSFLIDNGCELLLIDVGISYAKLKEKLDDLGYDINKIKYILITHVHNDHIKSLNSFSMDKVYSCAKIPGLKNEIDKLIKSQRNIEAKKELENIIAVEEFKVPEDEQATHYSFYNYIEAAIYFNKYRPQKKNIDPNNNIAEVYFFLDYIEYENKNYEKAIEYLDKGLEWLTKDCSSVIDFGRKIFYN